MIKCAGHGAIFCGLGEENPLTTPGTELYPGGHDFLWILCAPLAANREGSPGDGENPNSNKRGFEDSALPVG